MGDKAIRELERVVRAEPTVSNVKALLESTARVVGLDQARDRVSAILTPLGGRMFAFRLLRRAGGWKDYKMQKWTYVSDWFLGNTPWTFRAKSSDHAILRLTRTYEGLWREPCPSLEANFRGDQIKIAPGFIHEHEVVAWRLS